MITFHEGIVLDVTDKKESIQNIHTDTSDEQYNQIIDFVMVQVADQPYIIKVLLPARASNQAPPPANAKILFYRDSLCTAKYVTTLSDPVPFQTPIAKNKIEAGEVAFQALGNHKGIIPQPGAGLWLKNSGDASFFSGSGMQSIDVDDSANSISIRGTTIQLQVPGNIIFTHGISIETNTLGGTEIYIGTKNPILNIPLQGIHVKPLGGVNIGIDVAIPGVPVSILVNGIGWDFKGVNVISPTFSVLSPLIGFTGETSIKGITSILGATSIAGATSIVGAISIKGALSLKGVSIFKGDITIIGGLLGIASPLLFEFVGKQLPAVTTPGLLPSGYVPANINGIPVKIPFYI